MKSYKYLGPHDAVLVDGLGLVEAGKTVDVPPELADEFDAREDFEHVTDTKKKG